ncbi:pseudouridine synthase [Clarias magur]|uniref:Pseudouridine synthase n=1 Tax=Clarias magur TaxID=1594786 RepID=A0A8J4TYP2_CLAMG|nr:pseudouridine synthase [Clarias magur]
MPQVCIMLLQSQVLDVIMSLYPQVSVSDPASGMCARVIIVGTPHTVLLKVLVTMPALADVPPGTLTKSEDIPFSSCLANPECPSTHAGLITISAVESLATRRRFA